MTGVKRGRPKTRTELPAMTPEQAREMLAERRAADPVVRWFTDCMGKSLKEATESLALYRLLIAANQSGKTTHMMCETAAFVRGKHPVRKWYGPVKMLVVVPSRAQAAGVWGKRLLDASEIRREVLSPTGKPIDLSTLPLIPKDEILQIVWSYSPMGRYPGMIRLRNGSELYMALSGDRKSFQRIAGFTFDAIARDESIGNDDLGSELMLRLAAAQSDPKRPLAGWYLWGFTETTINDEAANFRERCEKGDHRHAAFKILPGENPAVTMDVRNSMRSTMSAEEAAIRLDGTASAVTDILIFRHQWSTERHVLPENYEPGPQDSLWLGYDPGWDHNFGLLFCAIRPETPYTLNIVRFVSERHRTLDYVANLVATWLDGRFLEALVCDPAAKKTEHSRGKSMAYQIEELLGQMHVTMKRGIIYGRNRYEDTIPAVQRWLDPDPGNRLAAPRILVNPTSPGCGKFVEQMCKYRRKDAALDAKKHYSIHAHDNEGCDLIRYIVSREPSWTEREPNVARSIPFRSANAMPSQPAPNRPDPLADDKSLSEEVRVHRQRLRESSRLVGSMQGNTLPRMPTGRSNW